MQAEILQIFGAPDYAQEIGRGAEALSAGKLLILPTETVYGVAGILTYPETRAAMHELRQGSAVKPFTIHVARRQDALQYLGPVGDFARRVMRKLWPGPVGLVFDVPAARRREVAEKLGIEERELYDEGSLTLRCPDHPVFFDIVSRVKEPVALTAAGGANQRVGDIPAEVLSRVEMVFDAGDTRFSKASTLVRVKENTYEIVRAGVYDERIIDRLLKTTILFVCSGNTCRSPMAEALARNYLARKMNVAPDELENKGISVMSAGSYALPGARATPLAVDVLKPLGLDLSRHRSRPLSVEVIHQADVIYTMSRNHASAVAALVPSAMDKVSMLDPDHDIEDPIGGDAALYKEVAEQIRKLIENRLGNGIVP